MSAGSSVTQHRRRDEEAHTHTKPPPILLPRFRDWFLSVVFFLSPFKLFFFLSLSPHLLLCLFLLAASKSSTRWFQPPASSFVSSTLSVFPSSLLVCGRTGTRLGRWQVLHKRRHIASFAPISDYTHR